MYIRGRVCTPSSTALHFHYTVRHYTVGHPRSLSPLSSVSICQVNQQQYCTVEDFPLSLLHHLFIFYFQNLIWGLGLQMYRRASDCFESGEPVRVGLF